VVREDDGDQRRGALGRFGRRGCPRHDRVHRETNQFGRQDGKPFESITVESTLVLALDTPQLSQILEEPCPDVRGLGAGFR